MSRLLAACLSGLALAAILPAVTSAQPDYPRPKPGLWEDKMTMGDTGDPIRPEGLSIKMRICMDGSTQARVAPFRPPMPGGAPKASNCSQRNKKIIPGGYQIDFACTVGGKAARSSMMITGDFNTDIKVDSTVNVDGRETKMSSLAYWSGPCPASMKPGQVVNDTDMRRVVAARAAGRRAAPAGTDPR
jgi:hypothetical protein